MFARDEHNPKGLVEDSAPFHKSKMGKLHCLSRNIRLLLIPGGLAPYVQEVDACMF